MLGFLCPLSELRVVFLTGGYWETYIRVHPVLKVKHIMLEFTIGPCSDLLQLSIVHVNRACFRSSYVVALLTASQRMFTEIEGTNAEEAKGRRSRSRKFGRKLGEISLFGCSLICFQFSYFQLRKSTLCSGNGSRQQHTKPREGIVETRSGTSPPSFSPRRTHYIKSGKSSVNKLSLK